MNGAVCGDERGCVYTTVSGGLASWPVAFCAVLDVRHEAGVLTSREETYQRFLFFTGKEGTKETAPRRAQSGRRGREGGGGGGG